MRRIPAFLSVVGIASVLMLAGVPAAQAADPVIPPVEEIPDIPSRVAKSVTNSPLGDKTILMLRAMANGTWTLPGTGGALVTTRVISAPAVVARAAGGSMVLPFYIGYGIGTGGLQMYAAANGTTYAGLQCNTPEWYQTASDFIQMGLGPDCKGLIDAVERNADQPSIVSANWSSAAGTVIVLGTVNGSTDNGTTPIRGYCGKRTWNAGWSSYWEGGSETVSSANIPLCYNAYGSGGQPDYTAESFGWYKAPYVMRKIVFFKSGQANIVFDPATDLVTTKPDPTRTPSCDIKWRDGTTTSGTGTPYKESEGFPTNTAGTGCKTAWDAKPGAGPGGVMPEKISTHSQPDGGAKTEISTGNVPDYTTAEKESMVPGSGDGHGLVLKKVVGNRLLSCNTWEADCSGWWAATSEGTQQGVYRCTFAGAALAIAECGIYRQTFELQTSTPTVTDPATGNQVDWLPGTPTAPSTSTGGFPQTGTNPAPGAAATTTGGGGCTAGWSWNPVDWVINPLRCAFIPSQASVDGAQASMGEAIDGTVIGSLQDGLGALAGAWDLGSGCGGLPLHLEAFGTVIVHTQLLAACDEPYAGTAAVVNGLLTVACVITAILAFTRYLGSVFAFASFGNSKGNDSGVTFK